MKIKIILNLLAFIIFFLSNKLKNKKKKKNIYLIIFKFFIY